MSKTMIAMPSVLLTLGVLLLASTAEAKTVTLRWSHIDPAGEALTSFRLYQRAPSSGWGAPVELQISDVTVSGGVYSYDVDVDDNSIAIFSATALAGSDESAKSSELQILPEVPNLVPGGSYLTQNSFDASSPQPALWIDTNAGNSMSANDSLFRESTLNSNGVMMTVSEETNIHSHVIPTNPGEWTNYEYRGRMMRTETGGGIGVTAYSDYPYSDSYYRLRSSGSSSPLHLSPHPNGEALTCGSTTTGVIPAANTWIQFRIRVQTLPGSTTFQASAWPEGSSEPSTWQIECLDDRPDRLIGGSVGTWSMSEGDKYWDDIEVERLVPEDEAPGGALPAPILLPQRP
jgi:hypothetical protein